MTDETPKWYVIVVTDGSNRYSEEAVNSSQARATAEGIIRNGYTHTLPGDEADVIPVDRIVRVEVRFGKRREVT